MKAPVFEGVATALITPLNENGIDYNAFARLIDWQINEGVNALVVCGTTGESSTLTDKEHKNAIEFAVNEVGGRIPVIAGTGSNDTAYALELTDFSCKAGHNFSINALSSIAPDRAFTATQEIACSAF